MKKTDYKNVDDIMSKDGFEIHGMMFSIKEVLQCAFLSNESLYLQHISSKCNSYIISIKKDSKTLLISPSIMNVELEKCLKRNNSDSPELEKILKSKNSYMESDGDYIMLLTKGYVTDNFIVAYSSSDFRVSDEDEHVFMRAEDIEGLTKKNPVLY